MKLVTTPASKLKLAQALQQMNDALEILDELGAPGEIGSTLDLAIARLESVVGRNEHEATTVHSFISQLERELTVAHPGVEPQISPWET